MELIIGHEIFDLLDLDPVLLSSVRKSLKGTMVPVAATSRVRTGQLGVLDRVCGLNILEVLPSESFLRPRLTCPLHIK